MPSFPPTRPNLSATAATVEVLLVSEHAETQSALASIFENTNWTLYQVPSADDALHFLSLRPMGVVITEASLPDQNWNGLLNALERLRRPPKVIVTAANAGEILWADVLHRGGFDVLPKPLEPSDVTRLVSLAWLEWREIARPGSERVLVQTAAAS
jgi:DNA-binding NtrC family response regulator